MQRCSLASLAVIYRARLFLVGETMPAEAASGDLIGVPGTEICRVSFGRIV
jgi:hypothetical protein